MGVDSCGADRNGDGVCGVCLQVGGLKAKDYMEANTAQ